MKLARIRISLLFFITLFVSIEGRSQSSFKNVEDSLLIYMKQILKEQSLSAKENANSRFYNLLKKSLAVNGSFEYPFDSLKHIGKITSENKKVRVITWNLPVAGGFQKYFGFIQYKKDKKNSLLYELIDNRKEVKEPINEILDVHKWIGALYYTIIEEKNNDRDYYILLGFDFNNMFSSKKVIEVLSFDGYDNPVFGLPIFKVGNNSLSRVVFEFSARATMSLKYIPESKTIAFDHLSPSRLDYTGNYQFYGPDFTYDGFRFEKGFWLYTTELDLKNARHEKKQPIDTVQKPPEPGFLYKTKSKKLNDF